MEMQSVDASDQSFRRLLYMYGAVTQIELNNLLENTSIDTEERKNQIKADWIKAAEVFQNLVNTEGGIPDTISAKPLPSEATDVITTLRQSPAFIKTFANFPVTFEEVEIDKVVAGQRTVHLDFVEKIKSNYTHSPENLLNFCLHTGQDKTPLNVGRTAGNAFTFSSDNPSLRFLGGYEQPYDPEFMETHHPGGQPVHAVTLLVGYGISTMNVYRVGKRIILNNGFHRMYTLRDLGVKHVPVVVQRVTHPDLELPERIADLPREYLTNAVRPGLMKDFFEEHLTCEVRQRNFLKSLQIAWAVNENLVPR